jgi:lysophospholipase L1-like esterase
MTESVASPTYLALGDSMSIDDYTGVRGGGAVSQFYAWLKARRPVWRLDDRTMDGCRIRSVPRTAQGDLITLTIGGNDLLAAQDHYLKHGLSQFAEEHRRLLQDLRTMNPTALMIVGNVYAPQSPLAALLVEKLAEANALIASNARQVAAHLADIRGAFAGHEQEYLCLEIEPTLQGARAIMELFSEIVVKG